MTMPDIRTGLETALEAVANLTVYREPPGSISRTPAVLVKPETGDPDYEMDGDKAFYTFVLTILVSLDQGHARAQRELDPFLKLAGQYSIRAAIDADVTLGGSCDWARFRRWYEYGGQNYRGTVFLGVKCEVEAVG